MLNHRHLGPIQFKKQINSEGTYFGGVLSAACWCWLNIGAWWGRHAAFITLPLSSSLLRGYIFKVNDSMLKGLLCCLETLETTTACTWLGMLQKHQRNGNERDESGSYTFRKQGSSSKRGTEGGGSMFLQMTLEQNMRGRKFDRIARWKV